jgi:hypothetical protein
MGDQQTEAGASSPALVLLDQVFGRGQPLQPSSRAELQVEAGDIREPVVAARRGEVSTPISIIERSLSGLSDPRVFQLFCDGLHSIQGKRAILLRLHQCLHLLRIAKAWEGNRQRGARPYPSQRSLHTRSPVAG